MASDERRLVYSSDGSLPLPPVRRDRAAPRAKNLPPNDGTVRVGCEKRRGGTLTLVYGLAPAEVETLVAELRRRCATGGTAKDGVVALQGDRREAVLAYFAARNRRAKAMGG